MPPHELLVAVASGFLDDDGLCEIIAGKTRIDPELLRERPQYLDFFEPGVSVRGTDASRCEARARSFDGRVIAIEV